MDLKASGQCKLSLISAQAPAKLTDADMDAHILHVFMPGPATVWVDGIGFEIPLGETRWVRSTSMTYSLTPPEEPPL